MSQAFKEWWSLHRDSIDTDDEVTFAQFVQPEFTRGFGNIPNDLCAKDSSGKVSLPILRLYTLDCCMQLDLSANFVPGVVRYAEAIERWRLGEVVLED